MTQAAEPNDGAGQETPVPPEGGDRPAAGSARVPAPRPAGITVNFSPGQQAAPDQPEPQPQPQRQPQQHHQPQTQPSAAAPGRASVPVPPASAAPGRASVPAPQPPAPPYDASARHPQTVPFTVPEQPQRPSQQPPAASQPGRAAVPAPPGGSTYQSAPGPQPHQDDRHPQAYQSAPGPQRYQSAPGAQAYQGAPTPKTYQSAPAVPERSGGPRAAGKRRAAVLLVVVFFLIALVGAGAAAQLTRDLPDATLATDIAATIKIPGGTPKIPWPSTGSAELMIEGMGRIGGSGGKAAEPIGSVAKVMTAYVILKSHPLTGDEEGPSMTVDAADVADYNQRTLTGQSQVRVAVGEELTERDALEALMLPSANNVAHMLAEWDAGDVDGFLAKMNQTADELGMTATEYTDPSGFLPTTTSTAADQVKLARAALKIDVFAEIVELPSAEIPVEGTVKNYNDLLGVDGVFGIKTGSTTQAGGNLLFAARLKVASRDLVIVGAVFNQPGAHTPEQLAAANRVVRKLLAAVRKTVKEYTLVAAKPVGTVRTAWGASASVTPASALKVVGWPGLAVPVKTTTTQPGPLITAGQQVGEVQAAGVRVPLRADTATSEPSLWWKLTRRS
ncbi:hypothetical protein ACTOB_005532 [Actinoplanes oblitus]|uniref:Peptidase S11 D-alanyl-D-alanine carboxypeptidase A N-terminal domain-containing protein n=1 Tax=Actinoplanes oblitus TaxID=3040509 RepID=A0ABY8W6T9_9ACTN|nr:hypothetical protein [Actinoplanes oblitus]WIM93551.1 hypothetical protein ACTOB_005532 [Actinoplanes oblitus]